MVMVDLLPRRFHSASLDDFTASRITPALRFVERITRLPADAPGRRHIVGQGWVADGTMERNLRGQHGLVIVGPTGVGKTHLLAAVANALAPECWLFRSALTIVDEARESVASAGVSRLFPYHTASNVLLLDDISGVRPTDYALDTIARIIRVRYDEMLPTVVTMHSSRTAIADLYGAAIASRLLELGPVLKLEGPDRRSHQPTTDKEKP